jgi:hypothetical protein
MRTHNQNISSELVIQYWGRTVSQSDWMLVVTIASLIGVAAMGMNLAVALWRGSSPRPVPLTTWVGIMVLGASVLWTRWDGGEPTTIVAAIATAQPMCLVSGTALRSAPAAGGAHLDGAWRGSAGCYVWAVIEDPRTGTLWLQGPASLDSSTWSLDISLAIDEATSESLPYRVSIGVVDRVTHEAWLSEAIAADGIVSLRSAVTTAWLARDVPL